MAWAYSRQADDIDGLVKSPYGPGPQLIAVGVFVGSAQIFCGVAVSDGEGASQNCACRPRSLPSFVRCDATHASFFSWPSRISCAARTDGAARDCDRRKALRSILPSVPFPETIAHSEMLVVSALAAERYPAGSCAARHLARLIPNFHAGQSAEHL